MPTLVLVRHGESQWNKENRFTGWTDIPLSPEGEQEAKEAALMLKEKGIGFDVVFTSVLCRAIKTANIILECMGLMHLPMIKNWRLNERMYGSLQGLNKMETAAKYGEDQVKIWRRSYDVPPPLMDESDPMFPTKQPVFSGVPLDLVPRGESLKMTVERVLPFWNSDIVPVLKDGKRVLIAAHGNSLRALVMHLDNMSEAEVMELNIPTGVPLVYELDGNMKPIKKYYLLDEDEVKKRIAAVANQALKK